MAIAKIQAEMEANKNNAYVQVVGEFLLQHLATNPQDAEKILNQDKTILKSLEEMCKVAKKKKVGNCAVLTDQEGFGVVLKYFGIDTKPKMQANSSEQQVTVQHKAPAVNFDISLDELLAGG